MVKAAKHYPVPTIKRRAIDTAREQSALAAGLDPLVANILAGRPFLPEYTAADLLSPKLRMLMNPNSLPDIAHSVERLILALENKEMIGIETDHDCDGQTSHAVIYTALTEHFGHPKERIQSYIGHRLKEGYGLSPALLKRILADDPLPSLIITADNGSSDEAQIKVLKAAGVDVIVTDHHEIPLEGIPQSAYGVINPTRPESEYPDPYIAGCFVAWLLMAATRQKLLEKNKAIPSLADCLDFVAVGTIADCVSIARSVNNRAVVAYGMRLIQAGTRPCWRAVIPLLNGGPLCSEDLGFKIGPLLNSDGRLACAFGSVSFLLSTQDDEAQQWILHLQAQNAERKKIQDDLTKKATEKAYEQYRAGKSSLCVFLEDGHAGVHGICASRIKDRFGRPVLVFCPKAEDENLLTGSARSIEEVHIREALQAVYDYQPDLMVRFGGHRGAAGALIPRKTLAEFAAAFEVAVNNQLGDKPFGPVVWTDGELPIDKLEVEHIENLNSTLEPFGREFEAPQFELMGQVQSIALMGQTKIHARLSLILENRRFEGVWFSCRESEAHPVPIAVGEWAKVVFSPKVQTFRGERKLSCHIVHLQKA